MGHSFGIKDEAHHCLVAQESGEGDEDSFLELKSKSRGFVQSF